VFFFLLWVLGLVALLAIIVGLDQIVRSSGSWRRGWIACVVVSIVVLGALAWAITRTEPLEPGEGEFWRARSAPSRLLALDRPVGRFSLTLTSGRIRT
jgi:hypothetical protein